jgi:hypothetical protein
MAKRPTWLVVVRRKDGVVSVAAFTSRPVARNVARDYRRYGLSVAIVNADAALAAGTDDLAAFEEAKRAPKPSPPPDDVR